MPSFNPHDLQDFVGKHFIYTYDNGWQHEFYIKNKNTMDYRIYNGFTGNRWVKDQEILVVQIAPKIYKTSWTEPTGTDVSQILNLNEMLIHGTVFYPHWILEAPEKTTGFQNDHLQDIEKCREEGPTYPTEMVNAIGKITTIFEEKENDDTVLNCVPKDVPEDYLHRIQRTKPNLAFSFDPHDIDGIIGKNFVFTYDNDWKYESYIKNKNTMDYRIHDGKVANRWVKNQAIYIVQIAPNIYKTAWTEPTGTNVTQIIDFNENTLHGTVYFPKWVMDDPQKTVCFQNDYLEQMKTYKLSEKTYPKFIMNEFAKITHIRQCKQNDDAVIDRAAKDLEEDFLQQFR